MNFPHKCVRCGYCCLVEPCPIIRTLDPEVEKTGCGFLSFDGETASCGLAVAGIVPIGDGCCMSARCFKNGKIYDFAELPDFMKRSLAQNLRKERMAKKCC